RDLFAVGRLRPGVTVAEASAQMNMIQQRIVREYPKDELPTFGGLAAPLGMIPLPFRGFATLGVMVMEVVVGLVLLIACVNAALVLLAQALGRQREWALRAALGAGRGRLVRQGLVHSVLLAIVAGGAGLGIARLLHPLLLRLAPAGFPLAPPQGLQWPVVAFTFGLALLVGILFGLAPALQGARVRILDFIKNGTPGAGASRSRTRSGFIIAQMALCVVILVGAALCLRSLLRARAINPGFDTAHLIVAQVNPQSAGYSGAGAHAFLLRVRRAVDAIPGVAAAGYTSMQPLQNGESDTQVLPPGVAPGPNNSGYRVEFTMVSPDILHAMGIPLLAGRGFTEADVGSGRNLVVINEYLAHHFWPNGSALGQTLRETGPGNNASMTIVGVTPTGKYSSLSESPRPYMYRLDSMGFPATLMIHVAGNPESFLPLVRRTLQQLDPTLLTNGIETGAGYMQAPLFTAHFTGILLSGFGLLALLLAIVGLYGVMAAVVAQRTREYGIRMALGADAGSLLRLVLGQGLRLALWGVVAGVILAALLTRSMSALLYGMSPADPVSYIAAVVLVVAVAVLASLVPALRATRVDPLRALRWE
ncbi:MAG: FtsX-like permease family protein, partial [Terriglobales bacterium]